MICVTNLPENLMTSRIEATLGASAAQERRKNYVQNSQVAPSLDSDTATRRPGETLDWYAAPQGGDPTGTSSSRGNLPTQGSRRPHWYAMPQGESTHPGTPDGLVPSRRVASDKTKTPEG